MGLIVAFTAFGVLMLAWMLAPSQTADVVSEPSELQSKGKLSHA